MSRYAVRRVQCMLFRISLPCVFLTHGTWAFVVFSGLFLFSGLVFLGRMMILIRSMIATPMHTTNRSTRGNLAFSTVPGRYPPIFCEFVQWKIDRPFIFFMDWIQWFLFCQQPSSPTFVLESVFPVSRFGRMEWIRLGPSKPKPKQTTTT